MKKNIYVKPETKAIKIDSYELLNISDPKIGVSKDKQDDIQADDEGYYWAE